MANSGQRLFQMLPTGRQCIRSLTGPSRSHWDPFSDVVTSSRDIERSATLLRQEMDRLWNWSGFNQMPIFSRFNSNGAGDRVHRITMDLQGCQPDDVKISVEDNVVTIEAKLEQKHNDSRFYQEWSNKYTLPENADTTKLKSVLDYDGILHIDAPISEVKEGLTTEIPINHK